MVQREAVTFLVGGAGGFDICPLCGQTGASVPVEQASLCRSPGPMSQEIVPPDGSSRTNTRPREIQKNLKGRRI
jgi:hypothetical protein